jgi:hypothetical protein
VPQPRRPTRSPPVPFDPAAWSDDMARATPTAREVAVAARENFETAGAPLDQLKPCDPEGPGGTALDHCVKVYLPAPAGPHGMVFEIVRIRGRLRLIYAAFGLRHPSAESRQPSVYEVAYRRLTASDSRVTMSRTARRTRRSSASAASSDGERPQARGRRRHACASFPPRAHRDRAVPAIRRVRRGLTRWSRVRRGGPRQGRPGRRPDSSRGRR